MVSVTVNGGVTSSCRVIGIAAVACADVPALHRADLLVVFLVDGAVGDVAVWERLLKMHGGEPFEARELEVPCDQLVFGGEGPAGADERGVDLFDGEPELFGDCRRRLVGEPAQEDFLVLLAGFGPLVGGEVGAAWPLYPMVLSFALRRHCTRWAASVTVTHLFGMSIHAGVDISHPAGRGWSLAGVLNPDRSACEHRNYLAQSRFELARWLRRWLITFELL